MTTAGSATAAISISDCPTPTVSSTIRSYDSCEQPDQRPEPPRPARPGDRAWPPSGSSTSESLICAAIRMRSPSSAPPLYGDDGSTASTATRRPRSR